jgi:hypothetical protein
MVSGRFRAGEEVWYGRQTEFRPRFGGAGKFVRAATVNAGARAYLRQEALERGIRKK